jgi:L-asparaginase
MKLTFIQAGGSIDKDYPKRIRTYSFEIGEPASKRILSHANVSFDYEIVSVCKKDSMDMTDEDRKKVCDACLKAGNHVIITHGTDTMVQTAKVLSGIKDKTIILTGASSPSKFIDSDADFNLGMAVAAVQTLPPGVYVAMNGRVFQWDKVKKLDSGHFVDK